MQIKKKIKYLLLKECNEEVIEICLLLNDKIKRSRY